MAEAFAPAKINLTLHVTGQRADGYHLLDSLVVFADVGDRVFAKPGPLSLKVTGPRAEGVPGDAGNLVWWAAELLGLNAELRLEKHLPAAAGIGGGSSDAAAAVRALCALSGRDLPEAAALATLGADVPVCLGARAARMSGIGEAVVPVEGLPPLHLVLVNPGVPVPTGAVFAALASRSNPPMADVPRRWADARSLAFWLKACRNDLELPARGIAPAVGVALARIEATEGCLLARMSGSGATCFGLFETRPEAEAAAESLRAAHPGWWVVAASDWRA